MAISRTDPRNYIYYFYTLVFFSVYVIWYLIHIHQGYQLALWQLNSVPVKQITKHWNRGVVMMATLASLVTTSTTASAAAGIIWAYTSCESTKKRSIQPPQNIPQNICAFCCHALIISHSPSNGFYCKIKTVEIFWFVYLDILYSCFVLWFVLWFVLLLMIKYYWPP